MAINMKLASRPVSVIRCFGRLLGGGYCFLRCTRQVQTRGSEWEKWFSEIQPAFCFSVEHLATSLCNKCAEGVSTSGQELIACTAEEK